MNKWTKGNTYDTLLVSEKQGRRTKLICAGDNKYIIFIYESGDPYGKTQVTIYDTPYKKSNLKEIAPDTLINSEIDQKTTLKNVGIATKAILMQWKELIECI